MEQDTPQPRPRTVEERQAGEDVGAAVAATVSADGEDAPAPPPASPEERATGMLGELKEQLAEAAGAGMETDKLDEGYRGAEADVVMGEYETATDRMQRLFGELDYARRNFIVESLTYCYNLMQVAPDYIDLSGAKQLYNEGNRLYDQDDVSGALRKTAECRESVDHLKDEHERILQMINQCRKDIEAGTERGVDLSASREKVSAARSHLLSGDFNSALTTVNEARSLIDRANEAAYQEFRQKAWTTYLAAKNMVETAKEEGLSIPDSRELLDRARTAFDLATNVDGFSDMYEAVNLLQQNELDIRREMAARKVEADRLAGEAAQLRSRVRSLSGHMSVANLEGQLSLLDDALSREALTEAEELLEKCSASIDDAVGLSPEIFLEISGEGLRTDVWSQISLVVSNVGGSHARNIRMNFDGPLEVRRVKTIDRLRCGEKKVMEVGIKFNGVGKVPIDVEIIYGRTLDEKQYLFSEETWLEVGSDAGGGGKRVTRIGSSYECSYCRKVIGGDDGVVKCSCNLAYHEHCARKASKCPSCNDDISNRPPIIRSQKVHHVEGRGARGDRSYGGGGALPGVAVEAAGPPAASGGALEDLDGTWLD